MRFHIIYISMLPFFSTPPKITDIQNVVGDFLLVLELTLTYFIIFQITIIKGDDSAFSLVQILVKQF